MILFLCFWGDILRFLAFSPTKGKRRKLFRVWRWEKSQAYKFRQFVLLFRSDCWDFCALTSECKNLCIDLSELATFLILFDIWSLKSFFSFLLFNQISCFPDLVYYFQSDHETFFIWSGVIFTYFFSLDRLVFPWSTIRISTISQDAVNFVFKYIYFLSLG